jgi:membrane-bound lytic murein transglycosylase D
MNREREAVAAVLKKLGFKKYQTEELSFHELRIVHLFGSETDTTTFRQAAERVRVQEGMRESFREGLIRSKCYLTAIRDILKSEGLPEKLAYLPHVESSFNPQAYSKYGAAGMWQITRSTGKRYLRIDEKVDERRNLYCSTVAAAKILKENYRVLGEWPLAVTAYNHGRQGMLRAVDTLGTRNLITIIQEYQSRKFGFASKNFYAEFLAAVQVAENPSLYFGDLVQGPPIRPRRTDIT